MDAGHDQQRGERQGTAPAGSGSMPTSSDLHSLGATFLQRQLKDLLKPEGQQPGKPPAMPEPGQGAQSSPSLAALWPGGAPGEAPAQPPAESPAAQRPLNGTTPSMTPPAHDAAPLVAAAAALAEPSPAPAEHAAPCARSPAETGPACAQPPQPQAGAAAAPDACNPPAAPHPPAAEEQQQQPATAAPLAHPAAVPCTEPPDPQQPALTPREAAGLAAVEVLLDQLAQLDMEGWFRAPVREVEAPGYYKIIKRPMCFQVMRAKLAGRQYATWTELVRDFELICNNALRFNQKKSRVYKLAQIMQKAGRKLLAEVEREGRHAVVEMHSPGPRPSPLLLLQQQQQQQQQQQNGLGAAAPAAAAAAEPQDSQAVPSSLLRSDALGVTSTGATPPSARCLNRSLSTMDTATTGDSARGALLGAAALDPPGAAGGLEEELAGYSSYSDTDLEDEWPAGLPEERAAAGEPPQPQLVGPAVVVLPYAGGAAAQQHEQQAAAARPPSGLPQAWKQSRRGVEWRIRWLELRMRELRHQRQRYVERRASHAQQAQQQQPAGPSAAAPAAAAEVALADGPVQPAALQQRVDTQQQPPAAAEAGPSHQPHPRRPLGDLQLPGILSHPFFGEHSVVGKRAAQQAQQQQQARQATLPSPLSVGGRPPVGAAVATAGASPGAAALTMQLDDTNYAARAHAALDLMERRLGALRSEILAMQRPGSVLLAAQRGAGARAGAGGAVAGLPALPHRPGPGRPRGRPPGGGTPRSRSGLSAAGKASSRYDRGDRLGKRRREEVDFDLALPKYVERVQVKTIDTPKVRQLPAAELKQREAALAAYAANLREGKPEPEAATPLAAVCGGEAAAGGRGGGDGDGDGDGSSSEEDISDEAYAARHHALEVAERARYESFAAGQLLQRNKKPTKLTQERGKLSKPGRTASLAATPTSVASLGAAAAAAAATPSPAAGALGLPPSVVASAPRGPALPPAASAPAVPSPVPLAALPVPRSLGGGGAAAVAGRGGQGVGVGGPLPVLVVPLPAGAALAAAQLQAAAAAVAQQGEAGPPEPSPAGAAQGAAGQQQQQQPQEASGAQPPAQRAADAAATTPTAHQTTLPVAALHSSAPSANGPADPLRSRPAAEMQPPPPRDVRTGSRVRAGPRLRSRK